MSKPPAPYDRKGRCPCHPQIRLRKRNKWGLGWTVLRVRCPLCYLAALPPVAEKKKMTNASCPDESTGSPVSSVSPTISTVSTRASSTSENRGAACAGMPYRYTFRNRSYRGFFTGELSEGGIPHGVGSWRAQHDSSMVVEGEWFNGLYLKSSPAWTGGAVTISKTQLVLDLLGGLGISVAGQEPADQPENSSHPLDEIVSRRSSSSSIQLPGEVEYDSLEATHCSGSSLTHIGSLPSLAEDDEEDNEDSPDKEIDREDMTQLDDNLFSGLEDLAASITSEQRAKCRVF
ncbi:hypothetical protein ACHAXT_004933 [Thalassiosira profunda]